MTTRQNFAFRIVSRPGTGGMMRTHVVVGCGNCTNELAIPCTGSNPPEHISKAIRQRGWEFDTYNRRLARCPGCIELRDNHRHGDSGKKVVQLFGKKVPLLAQIVPDNPHHLDPTPLNTFTVILRSRRSAEQLHQMFEGKLEIVEIRPHPEPIPAEPTVVGDGRKIGALNRVIKFQRVVDTALTDALSKRPTAPPDTLAKYLNRSGIKPYGKAREWTGNNLLPHLERVRAQTM